jgi:hypothetical protein
MLTGCVLMRLPVSLTDETGSITGADWNTNLNLGRAAHCKTLKLPRPDKSTPARRSRTGALAMPRYTPPVPPLTGLCMTCSQRVKLRKNGTVWRHARRTRVQPSRRWCRVRARGRTPETMAAREVLLREHGIDRMPARPLTCLSDRPRPPGKSVAAGPRRLHPLRHHHPTAVTRRGSGSGGLPIGLEATAASAHRLTGRHCT